MLALAFAPGSLGGGLLAALAAAAEDNLHPVGVVSLVEDLLNNPNGGRALVLNQPLGFVDTLVLIILDGTDNPFAVFICLNFVVHSRITLLSRL